MMMVETGERPRIPLVCQAPVLSLGPPVPGEGRMHPGFIPIIKSTERTPANDGTRGVPTDERVILDQWTHPDDVSRD